MGEATIARTEDTRPVLSAIRALLKFKDSATIADVARMAEVKQRAVLDVLNRNGHMVWRDRTSGKIKKVDPITVLREALWQSGDFYRESTYGAWSVEGHCLVWNGREELREQLQASKCIGAFGDSTTIKVVLDTPENRAAVEAAGLRPWSEAVIDDRLWIESPAARSTPPAGSTGEDAS